MVKKNNKSIRKVTPTKTQRKLYKAINDTLRTILNAIFEPLTKEEHNLLVSLLNRSILEPRRIKPSDIKRVYSLRDKIERRAIALQVARDGEWEDKRCIT